MGSGQSNEQTKTMGVGRLREDRKIYKLVDIHGGGELIPWLRYAQKSGDDSILDSYIDTKLKEFMYNQGKGKVCTITELVKMRNKERNERLSAFSRKKGKGKSGPNVLDEFKQEGENVGDLKKALKLLDGGGKGGKAESKYRDVVWKLDERGSMGETILGVCLLQSSEIHNALALKILDAYPKLVNDINVSEDYYGLTPLHQAIINQDPAMVFTLLKRGADVNNRCYGAFFCAEDQKSGRTDSLEHEYVDLPMKTNYTGNMYFGEYPLSFAACMDQPDCYRLLLAKKANPNAQDTNGNTVLHMCVIHENMRMFRIAMENGAQLKIQNKQKLTPLTLAAKMGNKKMFDFILEIEGIKVWMYGDASSTAYPLAKIDSIDENTGELNENSALSLAVYGESAQHLDLLDGPLDKLVEEKWNAFGKSRILLSLIGYVFHWIIVIMAFFMRPIGWSTESLTRGFITRDGRKVEEKDLFCYNKTYDYYNVHTVSVPHTDTSGESVIVPDGLNPNGFGLCDHMLSISETIEEQSVLEIFIKVEQHYNRTGVTYWGPSLDQCHLLDWFNPELGVFYGSARLFLEIAIVGSVIVQIFLDVQDIRHIGFKKWRNILSAFPAKIAYKMSFFGVALMIPLRLMCGFGPGLLVADNIIAILTVLLTTIHFLFYCRAVSFVGPFVLMIYTIIATDIKRFLMIYGIFLIGFSQAFYLVFLTCERDANPFEKFKHGADPSYQHFLADEQFITLWHEYDEKRFDMAIKFENLIQNPIEAFIRTFILTIGEFTMLYRNLAACPSRVMIWVGKFLFLIFEMCVSILQFNLLIAMMTRTYETIFRTKKEYKRQFARVILMLEVSLSPKDRLMYMLRYSRPTGTNKKARSLVVNKKSSDSTDKSEEDIKNAQQEKEAKQAEERRQLIKRKIKDIEQRENRPITQQHGRTPRPVTQAMR